MSHPSQNSQRQLNYTTMYNQVAYRRSLIGLGTQPEDWTPAIYEKGMRDVLHLSYDEIQQQNNTLSENVFRKIGIAYNTEHILITPILLEISESSFGQRNANEVVPQVITEMNQQLDIIANRNLMAVATAGNAYTWTNQQDFINFALGIASTANMADLRKHLIIPESLYIAMLSGVENPSYPTWFSALINRMAEVNTSVIVSSVSTHVLLVQELFLAEYSGVEPHVYEEGYDARKHEHWLHFMMSNTDYKVRQPGALVSYQIDNMPTRMVPVRMVTLAETVTAGKK